MIRPGRRRFAAGAAAAVVGGLAMASVLHAGPAPPKVYVFTAEPKGATPTEDEQGRLDSVRDLIEALGKNRKIAISPDAAGSQVQVEVVGREKRDSPAGGFGGRTVTPLVETLLRLRVTYGARESEIKGIGQAYWSRAAKDAADRLVRWILRMPSAPKGMDEVTGSVAERVKGEGRLSGNRPRSGAGTAWGCCREERRVRGQRAAPGLC